MCSSLLRFSRSTIAKNDTETAVDRQKQRNTLNFQSQVENGCHSFTELSSFTGVLATQEFLRKSSTVIELARQTTVARQNCSQ